jgi:NitT/TauT family transport system substrate-binding protein
LVNSSEIPGVLLDMLSVNESYLISRPENVKKVMRGWFKAVDYWRNNTVEANQIMATYFNLQPQEFSDFISGLKWPTYSENLVFYGTKDNPGELFNITNTFSDAFLRIGSISAKPDMAKSIDQSLLEDLYK